MASLATIINRTPTFKVEIFNSSYNPEDADIYSNNPDIAGWYQIPSTTVGMLRLKVDDSIYKKTTAEFEILQDELWMYSLDMILKRQPDPGGIGIDANQQPDISGSRLVIQIDVVGISSPDVVGTIQIKGTIDGTPDQIETITINGSGGYTTVNAFESINTGGISSYDLSCNLSIFADVGTPNTRHEIRISCDTNSDNIYGLMFAGYMMPVTNKVSLSQTTVAIKCTDYTEFLMSNEMIVGNRAEYVCSNYTTTGISGDCTSKATGDAALHWYSVSAHTDANKMCYIGDMNTYHPDGTRPTSADYFCTDYSANTAMPLPYCGYANKTGYATDTDDTYAFAPYTYMMAMEMIKRMCTSVDYEVTSRQFDMAVKGYATINDVAGINAVATTMPYDNCKGTIETNDLVKVDNEWMLVTSNPFSPMGVTRARQLTVGAPHVNDSEIVAYKCSNSTFANDNYDQIQEAQVKSDIYKTGTSLAKIMTSASSDALFVFWIDKFKQLQITELNLANPGSTGGGSASALALSLNDITKVTSVNKSGVVNKVSAWVMIGTQPLYCELDTNRIATDAQLGSDANYDTSINLFGIHSEQLTNAQLNSVTIDAAGYKGFKTFAYNYLKQHAYPKFTQSIVVDSFIPDEHNVYTRGTWDGGAWGFNTTMEDPLLKFTDEYNEHIDLLGRKINAPDFNLEDTPIKTFIIESIHYNITEKGNFDTRIVMSRISTKGDY